jgi:hypothetical protein
MIYNTNIRHPKDPHTFSGVATIATTTIIIVISVITSLIFPAPKPHSAKAPAFPQW